MIQVTAWKAKITSGGVQVDYAWIDDDDDGGFDADKIAKLREQGVASTKKQG